MSLQSKGVISATHRFSVMMPNKPVAKICVNNQPSSMDSQCLLPFYNPNYPLLANDTYILA